MKSSLKTRMRIGLFVCLSCTAIATLTEWRELKPLEARAAKLQQQAELLLTRVAKFSEFAVLLPETIDQIDTAQTTTQLEKATHDASALLERSTAEFARLHPETREISVKFQDALGNLSQYRKAEIALYSQSQTKAVEAMFTLDKVSHQVKKLRERSQRILPPDATGSDVADQNAFAVAQLFLLAEIDASILHMVLVGSSLEGASFEETLQRQKHMNKHFKKFVYTVAKLPNSDIKTALEFLQLDLSAILFGPSGTYEMAHQLRDLVKDRRAAARAILPLGITFTQEAENASALLTKEFQIAAQNTRATMRHVIKVALTSNILLVGIAFVLLFIVFEKLVISRVSTLSKHIDNINGGRLDIPVKAQGDDEITVLEGAIENARLTNLDLRRSNEELQQFAYIAAHDLRSPLRAVSNLVDWTIEDFGDEIPEDARKNLDLIDGRVARLSNHLSALLEYARAGQSDAHFEPFDLIETQKLILNDHIADQDFQVTVVGDPLYFETFVTPLKTILVNLTSNALKHHDKNSGRIEVKVTKRHTTLEIAFKDDGPGIPAEYQSKVFELFQTIQTRDNVEGSGLGLALVQKLVLSLGGAIKLTSDPLKERGTTFTIHLPETSWRYAQGTGVHEAAE